MMRRVSMRPPLIDAREITALQKGRFKLDCPEMRLVRSSSASRRAFIGAGSILQDSNYQLTFVLHSTDTYSADQVIEDFRRLSSGQLGEIISDEDHYELVATDVKGREWRSEDILPDIRQNRDDKLTTCSGKLYQINSTVPAPTNTENLERSIKIFVGNSFRFPLNHSTMRERKYKDKTILPTANALYFKKGDIAFLLEKQVKDRGFSIEATGLELDENIQIRLLETFQFLFARPILPMIVALNSLHTSSITIISRRERQTDSRLHPPLRLNISGITDDFCDLFRRYFDFVSLYHDPRFHPISAQLNGVFYASAGYFENQAVALSIAIESILKDVFSTIGQPNEHTMLELDKAISYIHEWNGDEVIRTRIEGAINAMRQTRALDQLIALEEKKVITKDQRQAWQKIRNKIAHTGRLDSIPIQKLNIYLDLLLVTLYHLIFYAIGYSGKYTDYSELGWLTKEYEIRKDGGE